MGYTKLELNYHLTQFTSKKKTKNRKSDYGWYSVHDSCSHLVHKCVVRMPWLVFRMDARKNDCHCGEINPQEIFSQFLLVNSFLS